MYFLLIILILVFIISLFIGSFLNVVVDRVYRGEQFLTGRSYCESCKKSLGFLDLVPVFSFIFLAGKCRYCKKKFSTWYLVTEIGVASIFTYIAYFILANGILDIFYIIWLVVLVLVSILVFLTDAKYYVIPMQYVYLLLLVWIIFLVGNMFGFSFAENPNITQFFLPFFDHLWGALIMTAFFGGIYLFSKGKFMGEGDIYLGAIIGLFLGLELTIVAWFFAFLLGAIISVSLIAIKIKKVKDIIPFGPFLILGGYLSYLFGGDFLAWYLHFIVY